MAARDRRRPRGILLAFPGLRANALHDDAPRVPRPPLRARAARLRGAHGPRRGARPGPRGRRPRAGRERPRAGRRAPPRRARRGGCLGRAGPRGLAGRLHVAGQGEPLAPPPHGPRDGPRRERGARRPAPRASVAGWEVPLLAAMVAGVGAASLLYAREVVALALLRGATRPALAVALA